MAATCKEIGKKHLKIDLTSTYSKHLLDGLCSAQAEGLLADVIIKTGDRAFSCHKIILAANSDYFKVMFTSNFQEKEASEIILPSITGNVFAILHKFLYSGELHIKFDDLQSFLLATDFLQMSKLTDILSEAIYKSAGGEDCLQLYQPLHTLESYAPLLDKLRSKICREFSVLHQTQAFLNVSKDHLISIITDKRLVISSEKILFDAIMLWCNENVSERTKFLDELLQHVRWPLINIEQLTEVVEPALKDFKIPVVRERIKLVKSFLETPGINKFKIPLSEIQTTPRKLNTKVMLALSVSSEADTRCTIFELLTPPNSYTGLKLTKVCTLECREINAMSFTNTSIFYTLSMDLWQFDLNTRTTKRLPLDRFCELQSRPVSSKLTTHRNLLYAFVKSVDLQKCVLVYDPSHEHFEVCGSLPGFDFTWENLISCTCGVFMFVKMFPTKVIHCYQYHIDDNSWSTHDLQNTEELYMIGSWENDVYFCAQQEKLYCYNTLTKKLSKFTPLPPVDFSGDRTFIQTVAVDGHIYELSLDKDATAYKLMVYELIIDSTTKPYWSLQLREPVVPILRTDLYPFQFSDRFGVQLEAFVA